MFSLPIWFHHASPLTKKQVGDIFKGTPDIEFEQDWSVGLVAILADGQKIKNYLSNLRDFFSRGKPIVSYCWASNVL